MGRSTGWAARTTLRPTGPFDSELPVFSFRRGDGKFEAILFNHSTHTIGSHKPGVRSPAFYRWRSSNREGSWRNGHLLRRSLGSTITSTCPFPKRHTGSKTPCCGPSGQCRAQAGRSRSVLKKEITVRVRRFDEAADSGPSPRIAASGSRIQWAPKSGSRRSGPCKGDSAPRSSAEDLDPGGVARRYRRFSAFLGSSSRCWARRSSGNRRSATRACSSWPTTTSAIFPTRLASIKAVTRPGRDCTAFWSGTGEMIVSEAVGLLEQMNERAGGPERSRD